MANKNQIDNNIFAIIFNSQFKGRANLIYIGSNHVKFLYLDRPSFDYAYDFQITSHHSGKSIKTCFSIVYAVHLNNTVFIKSTNQSVALN